ncbi:hypothetical protein RRSWK_01558 [Rhodopirellula sp. SWK7]|nr:hypothetical protein RRSWK_01558 [Rhodopirellula sp. SWK7]
MKQITKVIRCNAFCHGDAVEKSSEKYCRDSPVSRNPAIQVRQNFTP